MFRFRFSLLFLKQNDSFSKKGKHLSQPPSTKLSVRFAVICSTLTEDIIACSGECNLFELMVSNERLQNDRIVKVRKSIGLSFS